MRRILLLWAIGAAQAAGPCSPRLKATKHSPAQPLFVTNNLTNNQAGGRLLEYDGSTGQFVQLIDNVSTPRGIAVGPNGNLFVASTNGNRVLEYAFDNGLQPTTFVAENAGGLRSPMA